MTRDEWEQLARTVQQSWGNRESTAPARSLTQNEGSEPSVSTKPASRAQVTDESRQTSANLREYVPVSQPAPDRDLPSRLSSAVSEPVSREKESSGAFVAQVVSQVLRDLPISPSVANTASALLSTQASGNVYSARSSQDNGVSTSRSDGGFGSAFVASPGRAPAQEIESLAAAISTKQVVNREERSEVINSHTATQSANTSSGESTASSVLKTIGMVAGVGPVVTGLLKLFGGSEDNPAVPALVKYQAPQSIGVEAGLNSERNILSIGYSQSGLARVSDTAAKTQQPATPIQINVQAMDSRSFMDHSDEIARAVRNAMLRSSSLNDVIAEL